MKKIRQHHFNVNVFNFLPYPNLSTVIISGKESSWGVFRGEHIQTYFQLMNYLPSIISSEFWSLIVFQPITGFGWVLATVITFCLHYPSTLVCQTSCLISVEVKFQGQSISLVDERSMDWGNLSPSHPQCSVITMCTSIHSIKVRVRQHAIFPNYHVIPGPWVITAFFPTTLWMSKLLLAISAAVTSFDMVNISADKEAESKEILAHFNLPAFNFHSSLVHVSKCKDANSHRWFVFVTFMFKPTRRNSLATCLI